MWPEMNRSGQHLKFFCITEIQGKLNLLDNYSEFISLTALVVKPNTMEDKHDKQYKPRHRHLNLLRKCYITLAVCDFIDPGTRDLDTMK